MNKVKMKGFQKIQEEKLIREVTRGKIFNPLVIMVQS